MYESEQKKLTQYLSNPEIRHLYLDSSIRQLLAMQLKSMREARQWSQAEVGEKAGGMKQSAIARLEDPQYNSMSLSSLKRLAKAFDVALIVRFAPFSEFISWTAQLDEKHLTPSNFREEQTKPSIDFSWFSTAHTTIVTEDQNSLSAASIPQDNYLPTPHGEISKKKKAEELVHA